VSNHTPLTDYLATHDARCPYCQYSLLGLKQSSCPECGYEINLKELFAAEDAPKPGRFAIVVTVGNIAPVAISAMLVLLFFFVAMQVDVALALLWMMVLGGHIAAIWLLAVPIHRLLTRSTVWAYLFNPITVTILVLIADSKLSMVVGIPSV